MVKLDRIDQPIFAGNNVSADDNVAVFGSMKTSPSYTMDLPTLLASADYQKGWQNAVAVGYAPFLEEMNGVQYGFSYQLAYLQQQGVSEWSGTTTYYKGSLAKLNTASGCQLYASKIDNNTGNLLTDTNSWQLVFDSSVSYATTTALNNLRNDAVLLAGNQTVADVKTFSSSPIIPTPASSDSSTKAATTAFVKNVLNSSGNGLATISKSANGYCKFDNGLIIQWGNIEGAPIIDLTFPTAFASTLYKVVANNNANTGNLYAIGIAGATRTTTSVTLRTYGGASSYPVMWVAIGY